MKKGFTLIELLVSFAIITAVSSVIIFNHKKFNDNLEITNLSFRVAIALRQAQVYGVSTHEIKSNDINFTEEQRFGLAYGVHFDLANPTEYIFFADKNPGGKYDSGNDILLETTSIGRGNKISRICELSGTTWTCFSSNRFIDFTFKRPEPDAIFVTNNPSNPNGAEIQFLSPAGRAKYIAVYSTGQISINDVSLVGDVGGQSPTGSPSTSE